MPQKPHIAVLFMLKNEESRIQVSLDSVRDVADSIVLYDTGSTDKTIDIVTRFCNKQCIPLRLKKGEFVDFSTSRNVSLDFADQFDDIDYLLMLDCNDELKSESVNNLKVHCKSFFHKTEYNAFHLLQEWLCGSETNKYYNIRLLKPRSGWRYKCKVHEYITKPDSREPVVRLCDVVIYQNRNEDKDGKTGKRFSRDKELLLSAYKEDPTEPRMLFYLAQTCECLNQHDEALKYYIKRIETKTPGFEEEIFHAYLRAGRLCIALRKPWAVAVGYFMKALEFQRVEPLIHFIEYFRSKNMWLLAYHFAKMACALKYPTECVLFVSDRDYKYTRWHLLGIVAYYVGTPEAKEDGKKACIEAIKIANKDLDKNNLRFYLKPPTVATGTTN